MTSTETIEIPLNKKKFLKYAFLSGLMVFGAGCMLTSKSTSTDFFLRIPYVKEVVAIACIILFGTALLVFLRGLFSKNNALTINEQGIFDSSTVFNEFISWEDITNVSHNSIMGHPFLMLTVKNPEVYIARQRNILRRKAMKSNFKRYGSPIQLAGKYLKCDMEELRRTIEARLTANR